MTKKENTWFRTQTYEEFERRKMNCIKKFNEFYNERQVSNEEIWTHSFDTEEEADEFIDKWNLNSNQKN